jgi:hypothetical protein
MKSPRHNKVLGIAVGERSMLVAEVHAASGGPQVVKTGEFRYPEGVGFKDPAALGAALGQFLKEAPFNSRLAIFGLPAKWVLSKHKDVPAVDEQLMADTLRLTAPNEFSSELGELIYDYAGGAPTGGGTASVLLVAVPKRYVEQISQLAEAARVRALAITPFSTAVAASSKSARDGLQLLLGPSGLEFTAQQNGQPRVLRYVGASAEAAPTLLGELRRAAVQPGEQSRREMIVWNDTGADETPIRSIGQTLDLAVRDGQLDDLGVHVAPGSMNGRDFATSISLAVSGVAPADRLIDFADSRLKPPPEKRVDRRTVLAVAAAVALFFGAIWWYMSLQHRQGELDALLKDNTNKASWRDKASKDVNRIEIARKWHAEKPRFVACLNDLTAVAPQTSDLYATVLQLHSDMKGELQGKATNINVINLLPDKLNQSKKFAGAKIVQTERHENKGQTEITFVIDFTYVAP